MIQAQIVCVGITGADRGSRVDGRRTGYNNGVDVAGIDIPPQHDRVNARQRAVSIAEREVQGAVVLVVVSVYQRGPRPVRRS